MANEIKLRALGVALAVFGLLYLGITVLANVLVSKSTGFSWVVPGLNIIAYLAWAVAGYVAASLAKTSAIANGTIAGVGATVLVGSFYLFLGDYLGNRFLEDWYIWLINGVILGALGGLIWRIQRAFKRNE